MDEKRLRYAIGEIFADVQKKRDAAEKDARYVMANTRLKAKIEAYDEVLEMLWPLLYDGTGDTDGPQAHS